MGCDIHLHAEVKIKGHWHHYNCPNVDRNYELFAKMANVRNDGEIEPIAERRGIPDDATLLTRWDADKWEADAHSHNWLSSEEVDALCVWIRAKAWKPQWRTYLPYEAAAFGYLCGNRWSDLREYPDSAPEGLQDFRFIFWFDN